MNTERNYGIDLLRLASMYLVVVLHVLGPGGMLANMGGAKYYIGWIMEAGAFCAVDVFALISGYVGYSAVPKLKRRRRVASLWVQIFFYSFLITSVSFIVKPETFSLRKLVYSVFPIATRQYWYPSAYFGVLIIMPWLNRLVTAVSEKEAKRLLAVIFAAYSVYYTFTDNDPFMLLEGYSFVWLALLYVAGAIVKKHSLADKGRTGPLVAGIVLCTLLSAAFKFLSGSERLISYLSPTVLFTAGALLFLFARMKLPGWAEKTVALTSPAAFGVFLIHTHWVVWRDCMYGKFVFMTALRTSVMPFAVLGAALLIFLGCLAAEMLRLRLFRALKINSLTDKVSDYIASAAGRLPLIGKLSDGGEKSDTK